MSRRLCSTIFFQNLLRLGILSSSISSHPSRFFHVQLIGRWSPPPPAYLLLVVHEDKDVRDWAAKHLAKARPVSREHFDSGHELFLSLLLKRVAGIADPGAFGSLAAYSAVAKDIDSAYPISQYPEDLWIGFGSILHLLPIEVYESFGAHRAIMSHLHDNGPRMSVSSPGPATSSFHFLAFLDFREVLRCMLQAMKKLNDKLWSGENADYPQIVFDSIKDNPSYTNILLAHDDQKEQPWFLFFFHEYLRSIWDMQIFGDVLARFAAFTCDELQHYRFEKKRPAVMSIALQVGSIILSLELLLTACCQDFLCCFDDGE